MNGKIFRLSIINAALLLALSACGDSDLEQIEEREIASAQRASELNEGNATESTTAASTSTDGATGSTDTSSSTAGSESGEGSDSESTGSETTDSESTGSETTDSESSAENENNVDEGSGESASAEFDLSGYDLIFSDEFNADTLDSSKWTTAHQWGPDLVINDELQYYVDSQTNPDFGATPFSFDGESLIISASRTPDALLASANNQPFLSGVITSASNYTVKFGYIEARIDFPEGAGLWPAFWMLSSAFDGLKPQLFIAEYDGGKPNSVFHNYNYHDASGNLRSPGQWQVTEEGIDEGFHTVGVSWEAQELVFYIDGVARYRVIGESVAQQDMYFIANFAVGGVWAGAPDESTQFPAQTKIDYIRAYRKQSDQ